jgi:hypothetical protein
MVPYHGNPPQIIIGTLPRRTPNRAAPSHRLNGLFDIHLAPLVVIFRHAVSKSINQCRSQPIILTSG